MTSPPKNLSTLPPGQLLRPAQVQVPFSSCSITPRSPASRQTASSSRPVRWTTSLMASSWGRGPDAKTARIASATVQPSRPTFGPCCPTHGSNRPTFGPVESGPELPVRQSDVSDTWLFSIGTPFPKAFAQKGFTAFLSEGGSLFVDHVSDETSDGSFSGSENQVSETSDCRTHISNHQLGRPPPWLR